MFLNNLNVMVMNSTSLSNFQFQLAMVGWMDCDTFLYWHEGDKGAKNKNKCYMILDKLSSIVMN